MEFLMPVWFILSMVYTRGSGSGVGDPERPCLTDNDIREMNTTYVTMAVREVILKLFRYIKTRMIELFDERYTIVT